MTVALLNPGTERPHPDALLRSFAIGRPARVFRLAKREPFERIVGWDVDPAGHRVAVVGPSPTELHLVDARQGRTVRSFAIPSLANTDPRCSLIKFLDEERLCWITRGEASGAFDLLVMQLAAPATPRRYPLGAGSVRAMEPHGSSVFVLGSKQVTRIDLEVTSEPAPLKCCEPVAFTRGWHGDLYIVETHRDSEAALAGDLARVEATRRPRLRRIATDGAGEAEPSVTLPVAPTSAVVTATPEGWAMLTDAPLMALQSEPARLITTDAQGGLGRERPVAPGGVQPAAVVSDGTNVYATFVQSSQPLRALEGDSVSVVATRIKGGALTFAIRPHGLFFQNTDLIGLFSP